MSEKDKQTTRHKQVCRLLESVGKGVLSGDVRGERRQDWFL